MQYILGVAWILWLKVCNGYNIIHTHQRDFYFLMYDNFLTITQKRTNEMKQFNKKHFFILSLIGFLVFGSMETEAMMGDGSRGGDGQGAGGHRSGQMESDEYRDRHHGSGNQNMNRRMDQGRNHDMNQSMGQGLDQDMNQMNNQNMNQDINRNMNQRQNPNME
jgi:hypothetical protein